MNFPEISYLLLILCKSELLGQLSHTCKGGFSLRGGTHQTQGGWRELEKGIHEEGCRGRSVLSLQAPEICTDFRSTAKYATSQFTRLTHNALVRKCRSPQQLLSSEHNTTMGHCRSCMHCTDKQCNVLLLANILLQILKYGLTNLKSNLNELWEIFNPFVCRSGLRTIDRVWLDLWVLATLQPVYYSDNRAL